MGLIPEYERLDHLRRLGLSAVVIELARGENLSTVFEYDCGYPYMPYADGAVNPGGPALVPLWACGDSVIACWDKGGRLQFIEYDVESPQDYRVLSLCEQGLLATLFVDLYEGPAGDDEVKLAAAADAVGFRYFPELVAAYTTSRHDNFDAHRQFVQGFVAIIDEREVARN